MIRQQKDTVGLAKPGPKSVDDVNRIPRLADVGITKELSTRSQQLAAMPEEHFETFGNTCSQERSQNEKSRFLPAFFLLLSA